MSSSPATALRDKLVVLDFTRNSVAVMDTDGTNARVATTECCAGPGRYRTPH